jgi:hypothetical protein
MSQKTAHKRKLHQARKMMKGPEIRGRGTAFGCHDWSERSKKKADKQRAQVEKIKNGKR